MFGNLPSWWVAEHPLSCFNACRTSLSLDLQDLHQGEKFIPIHSLQGWSQLGP